MSFQLVEALQKMAVPVSQSCRVLSVSRSGFYEAKRRAARPIICAENVHVRAAFAASHQSYGSRRMVTALTHRGVQVGRFKVRRLMRQEGLKPVWKRKFVHTTDSKHKLPIADNVLARQFNPAAPNLAYVSDITYIRTGSGWLYLAVVIDLFSRKVVGWSMGPSMPAKLVCDALHMATQQRQPKAGLVVHSDRGSQYASAEYQALLRNQRFICSMSRKGNCWDNSVMERFFLNLKMERVWQRQYANHDEARRDINQYIVGFYNAVRLHSTLGYLSPAAYEAKPTEEQPICLSEIT